MRPSKQILFFAVLAIIVYAKLYAAPSAISGLSAKNFLLYLGVISILLFDMNSLPQMTSLPGVGAITGLLVLAPISMFYAPAFAYGAHLVTFTMLADYKNELFDPFLFYGIAYMLTARPEAGLRPLRAVVITFGLLNVLALSYYVTGLDPFYQTVLSQHNTRFASYGGYSNQGAYSLEMFLPLTYYLYVRARAQGARLFYVFLMLASITGIALSGSRGAMLASAAEFLLLMVWTRKYAFFLRVVSLGAIGVVLFALSTHEQFLTHALDRMRLFTGNSHAQQYLRMQGYSSLDIISSGRTFVWGGILKLFSLHPLAAVMGFGWGTFDAHIYQVLGTVIATHNMFLKIWAELGLTGLVFTAWLGENVFRSFRQWVRPYDPLLDQCIRASMFIVLWTFMLSAPIDLYVIWSFTFGVLAGYARYARVHSQSCAQTKTTADAVASQAASANTSRP